MQLTFHENDTETVDGVPCILFEPDIDLYKDLLAHGVLEVASGRTTDPVEVYVLRWIAGQQAGVAPFEPPYTVVAGSAPARDVSRAAPLDRTPTSAGCVDESASHEAALKSSAFAAGTSIRSARVVSPAFTTTGLKPASGQPSTATDTA